MSSSKEQKFLTPLEPVYLEEQKLRTLAVELAKDIVEPEDIFKALGISYDQFEQIKDTRAYKIMYTSALAEWHGAGNTQKRVKYKSALITEQLLDTMFEDVANREEPLSSRVEAFKTLARFGGIGHPEPVAPGGNGQMFKLEIHLAGKTEPIVVGGQTIDAEPLTQTKLVEGQEEDEL